MKPGPLDKENFKSTVSFKCGQADIPEIVNKRSKQLIKYFGMVALTSRASFHFGIDYVQIQDHYKYGKLRVNLYHE